MSWSIALMVNTVKISNKCAKELFTAVEGEYWNGLGGVTDKGKLAFNPDHSEHMDYISDERILGALKKHRVAGDICFGSLEGDNKNSFWGYRFDGKGGMKVLIGKVVYG